MPSEAAAARYRAAGTVIASAIDLPGLGRDDSAVAPRWTIAARPLTQPEQGTPYHAWRQENGYAWLRFFREGRDRRLVFPGLLDVLVGADRGLVVVDRAPRASDRRVQQLVGHYVVPLLLGCDRLVLHASAVEIDGAAIAFVGAAGAGKSTLAAECVAAGARLVCDDALVIDDDGPAMRVVPMATPLRLAGESVRAVLGADPAGFGAAGDGTTAKRAVPVPMAVDRAIPLRRVYLLQPVRRGRAWIERISAPVAIRDLMTAAFDMTLDEPARLAAAFERTARLIDDVDVQRLRLPPGYDRLRACAAQLMSDQYSRGPLRTVESHR